METWVEGGEVLDLIASLVSQLRQYAAKLPAVVPLNVVPGGLRPTPEAVESYERTVHRFRTLKGGTVLKRLNDLFVESLEAFEAGRVLGVVQPLLQALDHLELMQREKTITLTPAEQTRLGEYRTALHKILPGNQPELEGAGRGL